MLVAQVDKGTHPPVGTRLHFPACVCSEPALGQIEAAQEIVEVYGYAGRAGSVYARDVVIRTRLVDVLEGDPRDERSQLTSLVVPALVGDLMIWQRSGGPSSLNVAGIPVRREREMEVYTYRAFLCDWL